MLLIIIRTLILYMALVVVMRIMGKQELSQLQPFEFVVALMVADLAAIPMQNTSIPLLNGIIPIVTLMSAQVLLSYVTMRSAKARHIICGAPSILVANGRLVESELKYLRYNINDLLEQLRVKDYPNLADVEYAILETNGQLSIIPRSQRRPVQPEDLGIETKYEGIPLSLIVDGHIEEQNLRRANLDKAWLIDELLKIGITDIKQVFYATLDTKGGLFCQRKTNAGGRKK